MTEFFQTIMGKQFFDATMPRIARSIEALNETVKGLNARLDINHKENEQWLDGQVKIDASTHTALLEAVQLFSQQFAVWFKYQTSLPVETEGQPKLYDENDREICPKCGLLWSYHNGTDCVGAEKAAEDEAAGVPPPKVDRVKLTPPRPKRWCLCNKPLPVPRGEEELCARCERIVKTSSTTES